MKTYFSTSAPVYLILQDMELSLEIDNGLFNSGSVFSLCQHVLANTHSKQLFLVSHLPPPRLILIFNYSTTVVLFNTFYTTHFAFSLMY